MNRYFRNQDINSKYIQIISLFYIPSLSFYYDHYALFIINIISYDFAAHLTAADLATNLATNLAINLASNLEHLLHA